MSIPESIPEDREESYPCDCGLGSVTFVPTSDRWMCDNCNFEYTGAQDDGTEESN